MVALSTVTKVGALALALLLQGDAEALGTNYEHDSVTTYCWAIPRRTNETKLAESDRTTAFSTRAQCPMVLTLSLPPADSIRAFDPVNVTWTVQVDFSGSNAINNTRLYFGPDTNGRPAQIVHSNVHSCVFGTGCDPFNDGKELVDKTVNKIANFSDNKATFADTLQFPTPGEYSVLAHIILPNFNESSRFDYAVYSKVIVLAAAAPTAAPTAAPQETSTAPVVNESSSSSGLSQGATIAIIVGAIVVVVALAVIVVAMRRRRGDNRHPGGYMQAPVNEAGYVGGGVRPSGANAMKQSDLTDTNSTSGFQSAWGGGGGGTNHPSGLDNTNQSSASSGSQSNPQYSNQYGAPPRPSDVRGGSDMSSQFTSSMHQPDMSASAYFSRPSGTSSIQNPRKKRVDSDVEL